MDRKEISEKRISQGSTNVDLVVVENEWVSSKYGVVLLEFSIFFLYILEVISKWMADNGLW